MTDGADVSCVAARGPSDLAPTHRKAPFRVPVLLAIALALAGCNAAPGVDLSSQGAPMNTSGRFASSDNPYNPIKYAQTSGFYGGR